MNTIQFCKMHGLGNDFVVMNALSQSITINKPFIRYLSHRYTGIGFDQLLLIESSTKADFACRIFNADGCEVEQCGNGLRCVARYVHENNLTDKKTLSIETRAGIFTISIKDYESIQVTMGTPCFQPEKIPFISNTTQNSYSIQTNQATLQLSILSMGNPHAVMQVENVDTFPVNVIGPEIVAHSAFPASVNVGFMEIISRQKIRLRTFERGVGETFSCGSNACAAVVGGILNNWLDQQVCVEVKFGKLIVEWEGGDKPVFLTGPAAYVFTGLVSPVIP
jgi:diaminopimelate epimerase